MLHSLSVRNFKAFGPEQKIRLKPISLVFGANSSGKSSILQSLLLLKQTLNEADHPETVLLPKGKLVDLGSFKEMIFLHDTSQAIRFGIEVRCAYDSKAVADRSGSKGHTDSLALSFTSEAASGIQLQSIGLLEPVRAAPILEMKLEAPGDPTVSRQRLVETSHISEEPSLYREAYQLYARQIEDDRSVLKRRIGDFRTQIDKLRKELAEAGRQPTFDDVGTSETNEERAVKSLEQKLEQAVSRHARLKNYTFERFVEDQIESHTRLKIHVSNFLPSTHTLAQDPYLDEALLVPVVLPRLLQAASELRRVLEGIIYLGPLREYPERHYIFSGDVAREVGKSGKGMPDLLFKDEGLVDRLNTWIERFGLDYELKVRKVTDPDVEDVFSLRLVDKTTDTTVSPQDVGFGISQILPFMVQSILAEGRLICVEQPEIHLHPRLQAELGSLLSSAIKEDHANQFLIETHSEHLILRLQRLVRRGELSPEDLSVVYVQKTAEGSIAHEIRLDEEGRFIDRWPEGFFEEGFAERFGD